MSTTLEIGTRNYSDTRLAIKMALSHMETLVGIINGYQLSEPYSKFGWTFFKLEIQPNLQIGIEKKFTDMLEKYKRGTQSDKITQFMGDYFKSKGCEIKVKLLDY
ncbi:MAG: hypothetical protein IIA19_01655 [Thaumarchaeota archaeon]|nr:hypothetical protein [Nitrososphaerota archaeon]